MHRNPDVTGHPEWFTLAFFHAPEQLRDEVASAGFGDVQIVAVEGVGPAAQLDGVLDDPARRATLMRAIRRLESEPSLLGGSSHLMAIATK